MTDETAGARRLLTASAVRERAERMLALGLAGELTHFAIDLDRLGGAADAVVRTMRAEYPTLEIPYHARWRHFSAGGIDRWGALVETAPWPDPANQARAAFDLAIVSVLLDAGAGPGWSYAEGRTGTVFARSEGLAVASFDLFIGGAFSSRPEDPYRVDAEALIGLDEADLARGLQVRIDNPIVGLAGRAELLRRLGRRVAAAPEIFGPEPRPGGLFDALAREAGDGRLPATAILGTLLASLGPVWPGRLTLAGLDLGDTWRHSAMEADDETAGLVPFHKLSQWLAYSLLEPLEGSGLTVTGLDELTGLPEYRNGGLFLDTGVLRLRDESAAGTSHPVGSELVVEWRALTVALLDRIAVAVRERLGITAEAFPLAKVLEGGTWATGRRLAAERRANGGPPLRVESDGTVF